MSRKGVESFSWMTPLRKSSLKFGSRWNLANRSAGETQRAAGDGFRDCFGKTDIKIKYGPDSAWVVDVIVGYAGSVGRAGRLSFEHLLKKLSGCGSKTNTLPSRRYW